MLYWKIILKAKMVWGCGVISGAACHTSGFHSTTHLHTHTNKSIHQICQEQFPDSKKQPLSCSLQKSNTVMFGLYFNRNQKLAVLYHFGQTPKS